MKKVADGQKVFAKRGSDPVDNRRGDQRKQRLMTDIDFHAWERAFCLFHFYKNLDLSFLTFINLF